MSEIVLKLAGASTMIQSAQTLLKVVVEGENRFNDVDGNEDNVRGWDVAAEEGDDVLYGYGGKDENGDFVIGAGLLDVERSEGPLRGAEVLTAEGKIEYGENGEINYLEGEANGVELEWNAGGHQITTTVGRAVGNAGIGEDRAGLYGTASVAEIEYSNGAPSAENDNDIGITGGMSYGIGFGFNVVYGDPDGDGIRNVGFEGAFLNGSGGITSEWLGKQVVNLDDTAAVAFNGVTRTASDLASGTASSVSNAAGGLVNLTGSIPGVPWGN